MKQQAPTQPSKTTIPIVDGVFLLLGIAALLVIPHDVRGDGLPRFQAIDGLFRTGILHSTRYSIVGPLFSAPLYLLGRAFGSPAAACAWFNVALFIVFLGLFWRELRPRLDAPTLRRFLLLLVFASMFPSHIQFFYGEVFTALFVSLGILLLSRRRAVAGWALIVLGAVNTPASVLGVALVAVAYARSTHRARYLALPLLVFALTRLECFVCRGSLWATGYEGDGDSARSVLPYDGLSGFSYPLFFGVLSLLLSFGKGLLFFAPGVAFRLPSRPTLRRAQQLLLLFVAGLVLAYGRWWSWQGGWFWGPRFLLIASIPAALALALAARRPNENRLAHNAFVFLATALSFWVGVNGLVFDTSGLQFCEKKRTLEALCLYVPELSVLWHPFVDFSSTVPGPRQPLALGVCLFWLLACLYVTRDVSRALAAQTFARAGAWWRRSVRDLRI